MKMRLLAFLVCVAAGCIPSMAIHSWELPKDNQPNTDEYWHLVIEEGPDCTYSFEKDGLYYWISDEEAATVMVVNEYKFFARQYCYQIYTGIENFVEGYDNPYPQTEIEIPAEVEYGSKIYKVTEIGYNAFNGCQNLESVKIPDTVNKLWIASFSRCKKLSNIELSKSIKALDYSTFRYCPSLLRIDLTYLDFGLAIPIDVFGFARGKPSVIEEIVLQQHPREGYAYDGLTSLRRLYLRQPEPPQPELIIFEDEVYEKATLYVPEGSVEKYKADQRWGRFANIMAESSGVEQIEDAGAAFALKGSTLAAGAEDVTVYKADGRTVCALHAGEEADLATGLYIIRSSDKAQKVIVR